MVVIAGRSRCEITSVREISSQSPSAASTDSTGIATALNRASAWRSGDGESSRASATLTRVF